MSRRTRTSLIVLAAAACVAAAVLLAWRPWDTAPAIRSGALGVWQEQTAADPLRLTVSEAGSTDDGTPRYWIDLSESSGGPLQGRLDGDTILVSSLSARNVLWRVTYDQGADVLLLTRPDDGRRHILRRVSR